MIIDIKSIYLTIAVLMFMVILCVITIKKLINIKSRLTAFLMVIEEIIGVVTFSYLLTLSYKAMEDYEVFVSKYGPMEDNFTFISIYFCASQIIMLIIIGIYKAIKRRSRLIKKRRIIK